MDREACGGPMSALLDPYSNRKAARGSVLEACTAGRYEAMSATALVVDLRPMKGGAGRNNCVAPQPRMFLLLYIACHTGTKNNLQEIRHASLRNYFLLTRHRLGRI